MRDLFLLKFFIIYFVQIYIYVTHILLQRKFYAIYFEKILRRNNTVDI